MDRALTDIESRIYDEGHRLIPGVSHDEAERLRHISRYVNCLWLFDADAAEWNTEGRPVRILDLGCGVGYGTRILANLPNASVLGVDMSEESIAYARENYAHPAIRFEVHDIGAFTEAMKEEDWDYIASNEVLEHLPNGREILGRLRFERLAVISTPYNEAPGVNRHHAWHHITEASYSELPKTHFLTTDPLGIMHDELTRPDEPMNLVAVIRNRGSEAAVRRVLQAAGQIAFANEMFRRTLDHALKASLEKTIADIWGLVRVHVTEHSSALEHLINELTRRFKKSRKQLVMGIALCAALSGLCVLLLGAVLLRG